MLCTFQNYQSDGSVTEKTQRIFAKKKTQRTGIPGGFGTRCTRHPAVCSSTRNARAPPRIAWPAREWVPAAEDRPPCRRGRTRPRGPDPWSTAPPPADGGSRIWRGGRRPSSSRGGRRRLGSSSRSPWLRRRAHGGAWRGRRRRRAGRARRRDDEERKIGW
jgi:hypothetical protein